MRTYRNILFALAALLWLPASAHCQLEAIPGFEFLRCEVESSAAHDSGKDCGTCCSAEESQYRIEHAKLTIPTPALLPAILTSLLQVSESLPDEVSLGVLTAAPPELPKTWHFLSRTALPVRAPSFVS